MNKLIFILLIFLPTLIYSQQNYYVSNTGSDENNGQTKGTAWQTIVKLNSTTFSPGDSILFERGGHWREQFTLRQSGTKTNRITISAYGEGDKPIIDAAEITTGWYNEGGNIWSINNPMKSAWPGVEALIVVIDDVLQYQVSTLGEVEKDKYFNNTSPTPNKIYIHSTTDPNAKMVEVSNRVACIRAVDQNYIAISNIEVRHAGWAGVGISADDNENGYIHIHNVTAKRCRTGGIVISGKLWHNLIEDCIVEENGNGVLVWGHQDTQNGCDYTIIRNCKSYNSVHNHRVSPAHDGTGFQLFASDHSVIENCESYDDYIPIFLDTDAYPRHNIARYNKMYHTSESIKVAAGIGTHHKDVSNTTIIEIYYNLVVNYGAVDPARALEITAIEISRWDDVDFAKLIVANNTIYCKNVSDGAIYISDTDNSIIKNNIFVFPSSTDNYKEIVNYEFGSFDSDYNFFHKVHESGWIVWLDGDRYSDLTAWRTFSGNDMNSIEGDPLFTDVGSYDFTLQSGSPAIGAGVKIPDIPQFDIEGNPLPDRPSMGAFEFASKASPRPSTKYTLNIKITGEGSVEMDGSTGTQSITVDSNTEVSLKAIPDAGWTFSNWTGDESGTGNPHKITMNEDKTITAVFIQNSYSQTLTSQGQGSVSKNPDQAEYLSGSEVEVTATPQAGWSFSNWAGDASGSVNPLEVTMDEHKNITAVFIKDSYNLTVTSEGQGSASKNPDQAAYISGSEVKIVATPQPGWSFSNWAGDASGSENPLNVTMNEDKTITAVFIQNLYSQTLTSQGQGSVSKNPDQAEYLSGSEVEVTATPQSGWSFSNWAGDASGSVNPLEVTMDEHKNITAVFIQDSYNLTVTSEGQGSVSKNLDQASFLNGSEVKLTATPQPGWTFSNWAGEASGSINPLRVTMDEHKTITAVFSQEFFTLYIDIDGNGFIEVNGMQVYGSMTFGSNTEINLEASAKGEWKFEKWDNDLLSSNPGVSFVLEKDMYITAKFIQTTVAQDTEISDSGDKKLPEGEKKVQIYPNPARDHFRIYFKGNSFESGSLINPVERNLFRIIDLHGRIVCEDFLDSGITYVQIPGHISTGIYIIKIILGGLPYYVQRMVISK